MRARPANRFLLLSSQPVARFLFTGPNISLNNEAKTGLTYKTRGPRDKINHMNTHTLTIPGFTFTVNNQDYTEKFETVWNHVTEHDFTGFIDQYETGIKNLTGFMEAHEWTVERTSVNTFTISKPGMTLSEVTEYVQRNLWFEPDIFPADGGIRDESLLECDLEDLTGLELTEIYEHTVGPDTYIDWNEYNQGMSRPVLFTPEYEVG